MFQTHHGQLRVTLVICVSIVLQIWTTAFAQPTIVVDKKVTTLYQHETTHKALFVVKCITNPASKACSISIRSISPSSSCGNCFNMLLGCKKPDDFCVHYIPEKGSLNPAAKSQYVITLVAEDGDGKQAREVVDVRITANSPPYFNYSTMFTSKIIRRTESIAAGTELYRVLATDDDKDTLDFHMTTEPSVDTIDINILSGVIRTTKDLRYQCISSVSALVTVQDKYHDPVGPFIVNLDFKDGNEPPWLTNLDTELYVLEDEPVNMAVMRITYVDDTVYPSLTYTVTATPTSASDLFYIKGHYLKVKTPLDFETQPREMNLTIQASDGFCLSEVHKLTVRLVDVNEPPIIFPLDQTLETCEGIISVSPTWNITDPEDGDNVTFTHVQPVQDPASGRFRVDQITGVISTNTDYDIDQNRLDPTVELRVDVGDRQMLVSRASVIIRVKDCNDNAPVFARPSKLITVTPCDAVGVSVGTVPTASDRDSEFQNNNVVVYSGSGRGAAVEPSGLIVLLEVFAVGQHVTFPVYAQDQGQTPGPLKSRSPVWISIHSVPCPVTRTPRTSTLSITSIPPTTTTTLGPNDLKLFASNRPVIIAAGVVAGVLALLSLFMFFRYCWPRCRKTCRVLKCQDMDNTEQNGHQLSHTMRAPRPRPVTPVKRPSLPM